LRILRDMGARVEARADGVEVGPGDLRGVDVDLGDCPDLAPTLAALAVYARGVTRLHSAAHLRHKECDRIAAPSTELRKLGVEVDEFPDGLAVHGLGRAPDIPENLVFNAHGDHRLAMACALLGVGTRRAVQVDAPTVVGKSFPDFWEIWRQVLA
ncbi:MAG: 3-phosphoshikimate 1-carboxyvinyltransferase, partial [Ottowia sp.]|nr:3-phosphoshikimate 1-carboxyvinyltransferase [Ottowia sp.]